MWIQRLFFIGILLIMLEGFLTYRYGLKKVKYSRIFNVTAAYPGQEVKMIERISNAKLLPVPLLRIESRIDEDLILGRQENLNVRHGTFHSSVFSLLPFTRITRTHFVQCKNRGEYFLESSALTASSLLGFGSERTMDVQTDANLLVYPEIVSLKEMLLPSHNWQGDYVVRRWIMEDPFITSGVRDYNPGDPMKNIQWKATARTGKLQVYRYEYTARQRLMLLLNVDTRPDQWTFTDEPQRVEYGISCAASLAREAVRNCLEAGFGTNGCRKRHVKEPVRIPPASGVRHLQELLAAMARMVILRSFTFWTYLEQEVALKPRDTDYLILTAFVSEDMQKQLERLRKMGNAVEIFTI
jgi:uncharacterized protein (DUF58 family)